MRCKARGRGRASSRSWARLFRWVSRSRAGPRRMSRRTSVRASSTSNSLGDRSPGPGETAPRPPGRLESLEHRLELNPHEVHIPDPESLQLVPHEGSVPVEAVQNEHLLVVREHVRVGEPRRRKGTPGKPELDSKVRPKGGGERLDVVAVRFVEHDTDEASGPFEGVDQEPKDLCVHGKWARAEDRPSAGQDDLTKLPADGLRTLVDPEVAVRRSVPRASGFAEAPDELGGRDEVVRSALPRLLRNDPRGARAVPVRAFLRHLDPALRLQGLQDPVDRRVLDSEEVRDLVRRGRPAPQQADVRGRFLPREAEGFQRPGRVLLSHSGRIRAYARKGFRGVSFVDRKSTRLNSSHGYI